MPGQLPLTLVSFRPRLADKTRNLEAITKHVRAARGSLVVFPEMALTGYMVRDAVHRLAEPLDGPSVRRLSRLAAETDKHLLVGLPRMDTEHAGHVFNSALLFDADGSIQFYDKRQLATFGPFEDGLFFSPGREPGFMETPWGPIGVSICYDLFFPELMRAQALAGAVLLLNVSASPSTSRRFFEAVLPARAIENALPVAYSNFTGTQESLVFWGGAQAWGPRGTLEGRLEAYTEGRLEVEIDLDEARLARPLRPTIRDARRESIQDLVDLFGPQSG